MSWENILKNDLSELKASLERWIEPIDGKEYVDMMLWLAESLGLKAYLRKMIKSRQQYIKDLRARLSGVDDQSEEGQELLVRKNAFERHLYDLYDIQERLQ
jgi:predicted secreted protein